MRWRSESPCSKGHGGDCWCWACVAPATAKISLVIFGLFALGFLFGVHAGVDVTRERICCSCAGPAARCAQLAAEEASPCR